MVASIEEELGPGLCASQASLQGPLQSLGLARWPRVPGCGWRSSAWHRTWNVASAQGMLAWLGVAGAGVLTAGIGLSTALSL